MAQPNQASQNQDAMNQLDELEHSAEPADRTATQGEQSSQGGSPRPDTTAVVTAVRKPDNPQVNADQTPQDQNNTDPVGGATDPNTAPAPTGADAGTSDQPGASGSTDSPSDANQQGEGNNNDTSANNGVEAPDTSDKHGLELSINEIPNFDSYCTRRELFSIIDKAIQMAAESNNSRELLMLKKIKTQFINVWGIRTICNTIMQFRLGVELPVILKKLTEGVRK